MDGSAYGLVVRTGPSTLIGTIADLASESKAMETTLQLYISSSFLFLRFYDFYLILYCIVRSRDS